MNTSIFSMCIAIAAGMMIPFQSSMNAQLGRSLNSTLYSTGFVFVVATLTIMLGIAALRPAMPDISALHQTPKIYFLGGVLGVLYILSITFVAPQLGIGLTTMLVLLGQISVAILIDHFGWLNVEVHSINAMRLIGLLLMFMGVFLVEKY